MCTQLKILVDFKKKDPTIIIYFGATGKVVPAPSGFAKRVFYYVGIVQLRNFNATDEDSTLFPVMELVSSQHDIPTIRDWVQRFKYDFMREYPNKCSICNQSCNDARHLPSCKLYVHY